MSSLWWLRPLSECVGRHQPLISVVSDTCESSDVRHHQYSCGFQCDEHALEDETQWVRNKMAHFSSLSTPSLKVDFQGSRVTSDGGLILARELDEDLGFGDLIAQHMTDSRRGRNTQLARADLLRQSVYSRIAGYEDVDDAERLWQDPTFRLIGSERIWEHGNS